jgi:hypothetical protein
MTQQWKRDQIGAWFWSRSDLAEEFVVTEFGVGSGLKGSPMGWAASVDTTAMLLRPSRRQSLRYPKRALRRTFIAFLLMLSPTIAFAQTDEIQVYDAEIAAPGVYNLMVHNNYAFDGLKRFRGFQVGSYPIIRSMACPSGPMASRIGSSRVCICHSTATPAILARF